MGDQRERWDFGAGGGQVLLYGGKVSIICLIYITPGGRAARCINGKKVKLTQVPIWNWWALRFPYGKPANGMNI